MFDFGDLLDVGSVIFPVTGGPLNQIYRYGKAAKDALFPDGPAAPPALQPPPPPPDLTDTAVQQARLAARRRVLLGAGLSSTFLSGPLGDLAPPPTQANSLGGV